MIKFSVIVPSYNNLGLTTKCLDSIFNHSNKELLNEVIVVDDNSTDGVADFLEKDKRIKAILNKKNQGFAKGCNQGAKEAKGNILIFLNNDTEVKNGWLKGIEKVFKEEEKVGAVGVKLLFPDGRVQHAGVAIGVDKVPRHIYYCENPNKKYVNTRKELNAVTAACIAIPRKVFNAVGGFDEEYINGLEDVDLCLRIREKGYKVIYTPESEVTHYESVAPGRFLKNKHNSDLYMKKWQDFPSDEHEIYQKDGKSWFYIFLQDLKHTAYSKNEYKTTPKYLRVLRFTYIPLQKIYTITSLILAGNFKELKEKLKKAAK